MRAQALEAALRDPSRKGRATAFDFSGTGGSRTWIGQVTLAANASTGAHHHGRHEAALFVISGVSEIRWGDRLEFAANVGPGDIIYFAPNVPHQERNPTSQPANFLVVRSDDERIVVPLEVRQVDQPEIFS